MFRRAGRGPGQRGQCPSGKFPANHGFVSHGGVHVLLRDVLGLASVDLVRKTVQLRFADLRLDRCEGSLPVPDGVLELRWWKEGDRLIDRLKTPAGHSVQVINHSGRHLVRAD